MKRRSLEEWKALSDAWAPTVNRVCGMGLGGFILIWQTVAEETDRLYLIGAGVTLFTAGSVGLLLEILGGRR